MLTDADAPHAEAERRALIDAYWDEVEDRVRFLDLLVESGRYHEALTLCASYLDALVQNLAAASYITGAADAAPVTPADDPFLALVHPLQVMRLAAQMGEHGPTMAERLAIEFPGPQYPLLSRDEFTPLVRALLPAAEAGQVEGVMWKGTLAYIAYDFIKTQAQLRLAAGPRRGTEDGRVVQMLSVPELVSVLRSMIAEARARSHATGSWPDA